MPRKKTPKPSSSRTAARRAAQKHKKHGASGKKPRKVPAKRTKQPAARALFSWAIVLGIWGGIAGLLLIVYFAHDLPELDGLGKIEKRPAIVVKAHDGTILANYGDLYGQYLSYDDFPKHLVDALLATEDRRFFDHFGVDVFGLARAMYRNWQADRIVEGGSTITQQLAKNLFLSTERTIKRKAQEVILALWLEQKFTKEEIITLYLNRVYLGAGTYGVDAAAKRYFGKSGRDLNLSESALIVGLLKAPSRYSPTGNPKRAKERTKQVLQNMVEAGFITPEIMKLGLKTQAKAVNYREGSQGGYYFADWIMEQLPDYLGRLEQDLIITTTLDPALQRAGEEAVDKALEEAGAESRVSQAALVSLSPDGAVRAMVGGRDYRKSQFNRVTQAKRQPGSSFKLFTYLTALEQGVDPRSMWEDKPIVIEHPGPGQPPWAPSNYTNDYIGEISMTYALARSINTIAVQIAEMVGRENIVEMAHRLGITSDLVPYASLTLGVNVVTMLEMAVAYAHIANDGHSVIAYGVEEITDPDGNMIYKRLPSPRGRVLSADTTEKMRTMLQIVMEEGTGQGAQISGHFTAGKTGTSQDHRDAWFCGFSDELVTIVWMGNDDNKPMKKVTGGQLPGKLWQDFMNQALNVIRPEILNQPTPAELDYETLPWHRGAADAPAGQQGEKPSLWDVIFAPSPAPADTAPAPTDGQAPAPPQPDGMEDIGPWQALPEEGGPTAAEEAPEPTPAADAPPPDYAPEYTYPGSRRN